MWLYEKKLQYPVNIQKKDLKMAKLMLSQYSSFDGELSSSIHYLTQRYSMPDERGYALLTDIGTEELGQSEMIATISYQLLKDASVEELKEANLLDSYVLRDNALYPANINILKVKNRISINDDWLSELESNMALEQRAKTTYEHLMNLTNDPDLLGPLSFLRQRKIVYYQRFKNLRDYYLNKEKNLTSK